MTEHNIKKLYDTLDTSLQLIQDTGVYKDYLGFSASIYKHSFFNSLLIYSQKPDASIVTTLESWNKLGRGIKLGTKGMPIFDTISKKPNLMYVYDVNQTYGELKTLPLLWTLENKNLYAIYDSVSEKLDILVQKLPQSNMFPHYFKDIIIGYVNRELENDLTGVNEADRENFENAVVDSTLYKVCKRIEIPVGGYDFEPHKDILANTHLLKKLGILSNDYSYSILKVIEDKIKEMDKPLDKSEENPKTDEKNQSIQLSDKNEIKEYDGDKRAIQNEKSNSSFYIKTSALQKINYTIQPEESLGSGDLRDRYNNNIAAIKLLKNIEKEGRFATEGEQKVLATYSGWGGFNRVFSESDDYYSKNWYEERDELRKLLTPSEFNSARDSTASAFFTPPELISSIYRAVDRLGFKGGKILDPSTGTGHFIGMLPYNLRKNSQITGIEIDSISGRIAQQLYQKAEILIEGFEKTKIKDNSFDLVISNVPFGNFKVRDPLLDKYDFLIHDYFIAKSIDKIHPGGIVAVISAKGTMDKEDATLRKYVSHRAELVGAIRLPNNTFKENANAEVTTDIIFLRKRDKMIRKEDEWVHKGFTPDGVPVNQYFVSNPHMLLGKMVIDDSKFGLGSSKEVVLKPDGRNLYSALNTAIESLPENIYTKRNLTFFIGKSSPFQTPPM